MKITWLGTASIRIESCGQRLLFDPFVQLAGGSNPNTLEDFEGVTDICVTHGHVDHLFFVPQLVEASDASVHCPAAAADTLEDWLEDCGNVIVTRPGEAWHVGTVKITAYKGAHVSFSLPLVLRTLFSVRLLRYLRNALFLAWAHVRFPERRDTLAYCLEAEGKRILILGSLALDAQTEYPKNVDLLVLPFQGKSEPCAAACAVVERLMPKRILLDHFDDAFPPISSEVDTRRFCREMAARFPHIQVAKPKAGKTITL